MIQEISLKNLQLPSKPDIEQDLNWLCRSLGFVSNRDREETAAKIFRLIVDAAVQKHALSSEEMAEKTHLTRAAVLHHVKSYVGSGVIIQERTRYILRMRSLQKTIEEIEQDTMRIFSNLKRIAKEMDENLGLPYR